MIMRTPDGLKWVPTFLSSNLPSSTSSSWIHKYLFNVLWAIWTAQLWSRWLSWICLNDNADLWWQNSWFEFVNEVLDGRWLYWCLSHSVQFAFCGWMSNWSLSSAGWQKIDIEYWNQWTTHWHPWLLTICPIWICIADNLNWKLAMLIGSWGSMTKTKSLVWLTYLSKWMRFLVSWSWGVISDLESSLTG